MNSRLKEAMKDSFPLFTPKEVARIRHEIVDLYAANNGLESIVNSTIKLVGRIERHADSRTKKENTKSMLSLGVEIRGFPVVFWLCSKHSNPAEGHARLQGKLYCDRYWKSKLESSGAETWLVTKVKDFVQKNNVLSIQYIQGPPYYLGTRPYCKHVFQPIDLLTVLTTDKKKLEANAIKTYGKMTKRGATYNFVKHGIGLK